MVSQRVLACKMIAAIGSVPDAVAVQIEVAQTHASRQLRNVAHRAEAGVHQVQPNERGGRTLERVVVRALPLLHWVEVQGECDFKIDVF